MCVCSRNCGSVYVCQKMCALKKTGETAKEIYHQKVKT